MGKILDAFNDEKENLTMVRVNTELCRLCFVKSLLERGLKIS